MAITDPILADLGYVMETNQELDLLNFHKSFPITCRAKITGLRGGKAFLVVQPPGSVCLVKDNTTVLLSNRLLEAVKATIEEFDIKTGMVTLTGFEYIGSRLGERMVARVEPKKPIELSLEKEASILHGTLLDISLSGIGVAVASANIKKGDFFEVQFNLPEGKIKLPVKVLEVTPAPEYYRLAMKFDVSVYSVGAILRYIAQRRVEIFAEIQQLYNDTIIQS